MSISAVTIEEGCILCGLCEQISPEVFEMGPETAIVKAGVDLAAHEAKIKEAAEACPVTVIKIASS